MIEDPDVWSSDDLLDVADNQKHVIWLLVLGLLAPLNQLLAVVIGIVQAWFMFRLTQAVRLSTAVYVVAALIPIVGLVALLVVNGKATKVLRRNGVRVGLLGAKSADVARLKAAAAPPV